MSDSKRIAFIGAGNMASSLVGGLLNGGQDPGQIVMSDIDPQQLDKRATQFSVNINSDNKQAVNGADAVLLAVKPNTVQQICTEISGALQKEAVVISIAAGVREKDISRWLGTGQAVVRCMPNTPALLGVGITGVYINPACSEDQAELAFSILEAAGKSVRVNQESDLDSVTGVSGSGPAYFFHMIECMTNSGIAMGLDEQSAADLAIETAYGAALMARQRDVSPSQLRQNVTSPNGTTAAALASFENDQFADVIDRGIKAARDRAAAMADEFGDA